MRGSVVAILLGACGFTRGAAPLSDGPGSGSATIDAAIAIDAPAIDSMVTSSDASARCYGTGLGVQICLAHAPTTALDVGFVRGVSTNVGSNDCVDLVGPQANDYCVMAATSITITGEISAKGSRPLVLLSTGDISISGTLDAASHVVVGIPSKGPGADPGACPVVTTPGGTGGGAGGSFGSSGGDGGSGASAAGGSAAIAIAPTELRGGCPGGEGLDHTTLGQPGHGGGAVDLIATGMITISGTVNASGSGGAGAGITHNGGDGGGSGGLIALDAPHVAFGSSAKIFANGGGGGGGSTLLTGGADGADPSGVSAGGDAGNAGGGASAGVGGTGAHNVAPGQVGASTSSGDGAGGGGGGVGVIKVFQAPLPSTGTCSPPIT